VTLTRITSPREWADGKISDEGDGFVHLSEPHQVLTPANHFYAGQRDLELLVLDDAKLGEIRVEGGFPHLYDTLTADAVVDTVAFPCDDDGRFRLALVPTHADTSPARELLADMVAFLAELNGPVDRSKMPTADPDELWRPHGTFLVGWDETGAPVCCGGLKRLEDGVAEIKRMYVAPGARSRGHARRLLNGLEDAARRRGYERVRLDTGPRQPHAKALYESNGYVEIANYNRNPIASYFGEKTL
jgi:uncharacterized protein (DUF952 family)/GNAT superfamily N-acetyltransferase